MLVHDTLIQAVPVLVTLAVQRSFIMRFSWLNQVNWVPTWAIPLVSAVQAMMHCPLCLCWHLTWIWQLTGDPHHFVSRYTIGYVFGSSVLAYVLHHLIEIAVKIAGTLELIEADYLNTLPKGVSETENP
jgi:hypothetical protein